MATWLCLIWESLCYWIKLRLFSPMRVISFLASQTTSTASPRLHSGQVLAQGAKKEHIEDQAEFGYKYPQSELQH